MCIKVVVYSSRTRDFDGRIFVVMTVNSHVAPFLISCDILVLDMDSLRGEFLRHGNSISNLLSQNLQPWATEDEFSFLVLIVVCMP
jgi:hypothetical protein